MDVAFPSPPSLVYRPIRRVLALGTKHGVEVGADGRVFGLVRVWHWCGNDPVGYHPGRFPCELDLGPISG